MITKLWQLKGMFVLLGLFVAFAACVKQKDPIEQRNEIKDVAGGIIRAVNAGDLTALNKYFVQPPPAGKGPNRLLSLLGDKTDSVFVMYKRSFAFDPDAGTATITFTLTDNPGDSTFSQIHLVDHKGWKISSFDIK